MPRGRKRIEGTCSTEGCGKSSVVKGMCRNHYARAWMTERPETKSNLKRSHPLYSIWFERKQRGSLCDLWANDFWAFVSAVGQRPSSTHLLRVLRQGERYGPDNFEWLAALKREDGESHKAFSARKWASRRERFPDYEAHRGIRRKYKITPEEYAAMLMAQGGRCAICREHETRVDHRTHDLIKLAVDHCHETMKVRGLLCWRCNTSIGKFDHDPALLEAAAKYCRDTA